jgi:phosphoenolpyruvate carboxylase
MPHRELPPYTRVDQLLADLNTVKTSLASHGSSRLAQTRLVPLLKAIEAFEFHLAVMDLRQNARVHEAVVAELLSVAGAFSWFVRAAWAI